MKSILLILLALSECSCMFEPRLGAHIHTVRYRGVEYYSCQIVARQDEPQLAAASLDVCKDALQERPQPYKPK